MWTRLLVGAATFLGVHLVVVSQWHDWFKGSDAYGPWFMNASGTVAFAVGVFLIVNLAVALAGGHHAPEQVVLRACHVAAGAAVVMTIVLFTYPGGPGTLFPIAIAIGVVLITVSSVAGAMAAWLITRRTATPSAGRS
jgi:hypothetical protein